METTRPLVKAFIVDDDPNAMALLRRYLQDYSVDIIGTADDVTAQARDKILELSPDLLFLDVELPSGLGLDFCTELQPMASPDMKVVFYTGYDKYLLEALRRQAFDYMLKPASRQELAKIMTRFYENKLSSIQPVLNRQGTAEPPSVMIVNAAGEHTILRFGDIAFFRFQSERRLWEVITNKGECHQLRHRTTAETILAYSSDFVQIHKSYIVNVCQVEKVLDSQLVLRAPLHNIDELRLSKNYRSMFMATFYNM